MNAAALLQALGGAGNIKNLQARSSRLLLDVVSVECFDDEALLRLGVRGLAKITATTAHVILGPEAEAVGRGIVGLLN